MPDIQLLNILFENEFFLAVNKPAGLVCHPTKGDQFSSLISRARLYLGATANPHLVNRLDRETSGIVIIARSPGQAAEFGRIWQRGDVTKYYHALVRGIPGVTSGTINAPIGKDLTSSVSIKDAVQAVGSPAETEFAVLKSFTHNLCTFSLLKVRPKSGRKHQIRIHLQHLGFPIVGDKLYGGDENLYLRFVYNQLSVEDVANLICPFQALHASELILHWRRTQFVFSAPPENWFIKFCDQSS